uniref:Uncharacterized protein n=1 Tax=Strongyloides venezuelensis TaxID=75913 RepID=A0A0K0EUR4_STRVS
MKKELEPLTYENAKNAANYNEHNNEEEVIDYCKKRKLTCNNNSFTIDASQLSEKVENFRKYLSNFIIGGDLPFSIVENK